jgi:hypothetical protein
MAESYVCAREYGNRAGFPVFHYTFWTYCYWSMLGIWNSLLSSLYSQTYSDPIKEVFPRFIAYFMSSNEKELCFEFKSMWGAQWAHWSHPGVKLDTTAWEENDPPGLAEGQTVLGFSGIRVCWRWDLLCSRPCSTPMSCVYPKCNWSWSLPGRV